MTVTRPKRVIFYASRKRFPHRKPRAIFNRTQPAHVPHLRRSICRTRDPLPDSLGSASPDARRTNPSRTRTQRADYRRPRTPSPSRPTRTHRTVRRTGCLAHGKGDYPTCDNRPCSPPKNETSIRFTPSLSSRADCPRRNARDSSALGR